MVERRSPKPEVGGSIPSAPAKLLKIMKNPLKFIQDVKQEAFKVTWPTAKETIQGIFDGCCYGNCSSFIFFLYLIKFLKFFLEIVLKVSL